VASGWLPAAKKDEVEKALTRATEGHISLEWHLASEFTEKQSGGHGDQGGHGAADEAPGKIKVPSQLVNPGFLSPFQKLVTNYGIPAYGNVDPTILVTLAYLAMFGLMFGDAGHGLVLVLAGLAGRLWSRTRAGRPVKQGGLASSIPYLSRLVLWCGSSAIVTGVLFGSYFGLPLFKPVWFNFHGVVAGEAGEGPIRSIFDILRLAIYFGISIIGTGLLINWVNLARQKRWLPLFFSNTGILGGVIYAAGVVLASQFAASGFRDMPENPVLVGIVAVCALMIFLKMPLEEGWGNPLRWLMDWVISLLEIFSGYLANTLSFMRVAGLGIAHVTLMIAFFQIADMASPEGTSIWAVIILVFGNILVIALEGLSAGIQSLRLNYYEFFSKHFQPTGVEFKPIKLEEQ
jgi:V/A-type H+-transporting ATPase subunit I